MLHNTIHLMPPDECKTQQSQWTLATPEPLIEDEEEEATLEEEEANMETANISISTYFFLGLVQACTSL